MISRLMRKSVKLLRQGHYLELLRKSLRRIRSFIISRIVYPKYYISGKNKLFCQIKNDTRFHTGDKIIRSILNYRPVIKYDVEKVRAGDLKRYWHGKIIPLSETATFAYIVNGDKKRYIEYVRTVYEEAMFDETEIEGIIKNDLAKIPYLIEKITREGYDILKDAVIIDNDNVIREGLHRTSILWRNFGSDYEFPVLKIYYAKLFS